MLYHVLATGQLARLLIHNTGWMPADPHIACTSGASCPGCHRQSSRSSTAAYVLAVAACTFGVVVIGTHIMSKPSPAPAPTPPPRPPPPPNIATSEWLAFGMAVAGVTLLLWAIRVKPSPVPVPHQPPPSSLPVQPPPSSLPVHWRPQRQQMPRWMLPPVTDWPGSSQPRGMR